MMSELVHGSNQPVILLIPYSPAVSNFDSEIIRVYIISIFIHESGLCQFCDSLNAYEGICEMYLELWNGGIALFMI